MAKQLASVQASYWPTQSRRKLEEISRRRLVKKREELKRVANALNFHPHFCFHVNFLYGREQFLDLDF